MRRFRFRLGFVVVATFVVLEDVVTGLEVTVVVALEDVVGVDVDVVIKISDVGVLLDIFWLTDFGVCNAHFQNTPEEGGKEAYICVRVDIYICVCGVSEKHER